MRMPNLGRPAFHSEARYRVLHFGPGIGTIGGIASVLAAYARLPLARYDFEFVSTYRPGGRLWSTDEWLRAIERLIRIRGVDLVHVHLSEKGSFVREGTLVTLAARTSPVIVSIHSGRFPETMRRYPRLVHGVLRRASSIVALDSPVAAAVGDAGYPVAVVPNPVEIPKIVVPVEQTSPRVLYAGVISRQKGVDTLLTAWSRVRDALPSAELVLAGRLHDVPRREGPLPERHVRGAPGVAWVGPLSQGEVLRQLGLARVAVLPSRVEGMPASLLEAMAAGRPLVATPVGAVPDMVGRNGVLVPVGRPEPLAEALLGYLTDVEGAAEAGRVGRALAEQRYSPSRVAELLQELYDEVRATGGVR
jgi:glycosyltransferase involved in cell wall biosynthesis